jgi:Asp-tRNA(Asn)/Glu-tRNA(Gln) amidotransferase A subunit family amidase
VSAAHELSAAAAVALLARGELSAEELTRACLARIAAREPTVQAWESLDEERALAEARRVDASGRKGPLHGLPVGVKDLIDTADLPTSYGTSLHRGHRPARDAACVAALRAAGAVILGKTVTTELAYFAPGKTRNPRDPSRTPGGSSSGSAAAVADAMVPAALGTQTAGSVIRPASFCGVFGFKPTHGQLPLEGVKVISPSLDTLGVFARSLDDLPLLAGVLGLRIVPEPPKARPRIALCRTAQWGQAEPSTQKLVEEAAGTLERAGASVEELRWPDALDAAFEAQKTIMAVEMASSLQPERRAGEALLSEQLRKLFREGDAARETRYPAAVEQAARLRPLFDEVAAPFDALLTPAAQGEAPQGLGYTGDPVFNRIWTLLHGPCLSLPLGRGPAGMPVGLQLVAGRGRDARLLGAARFAVDTFASAGR